MNYKYNSDSYVNHGKEDEYGHTNYRNDNDDNSIENGLAVLKHANSAVN